MNEKTPQNSQQQQETDLPPAGPIPLSTEQGIPLELIPLSIEPGTPITLSPLSQEPELKSGYGRSQLPKQASTADTEASSEDNLESDDEEKPTCRHHWMIDSPHGTTSNGRCKICGEVREFRNSAADGLWENDGGPRRFPD